MEREKKDISEGRAITKKSKNHDFVVEKEKEGECD